MTGSTKSMDEEVSMPAQTTRMFQRETEESNSTRHREYPVDQSHRLGHFVLLLVCYLFDILKTVEAS